MQKKNKRFKTIMSTKVKLFFRVFRHLLFWGLFYTLYFLDDNEFSLLDFSQYNLFLLIIAVIIYTNLYLLFPLYFNKKKFVSYSFFMVLLILLGSIALTFMTYSYSENIIKQYLQNILNISILILFTIGIKLFTENFRKQSEIKTLENIQLKTELSLLKSQVNPHFLFNSLNNLYGLVLQRKNEIAAQNILNLSELMRYVLESSSLEEVFLYEEIQFINNYLELEKIRLSKEINIQFETAIDNDNIKIPPLLFIPMVENAFKHGIENYNKEGFAIFSLSIQSNELFFEATNSLSDTEISKSKKSGKGLLNMKRRLDIIYKNKYTLSVEKTEKTYKVILNIKL